MTEQTSAKTTQNSVTTAPADNEIEDISFGALAQAMSAVDAINEEFISPVNFHDHKDQIDYHQVEISKLNRASDELIARRTAISNTITKQRDMLRETFQKADADLKAREKSNLESKATELNHIRKSMAAHSAAIQIFAPSAGDNVETFRAPGSQKVNPPVRG